jgi:hypothetical protein
MPIHTKAERAKRRKKKRDVTQSVMGNKNTRKLMKKVEGMVPKKKKKAGHRKK